MKSKRIKSSCLLLGMSLILTACGQEPADTQGTASPSTPPVTEATVPPSDSPAPELVCDDSLIENMLDESGSFVDEFDQSWEYSYQVPQLLSSSKDARMINRELEEVLVGSAEEAHGNMDQGIPPTFSRIHWERHWNGSLLSLIVSRSYNFHSDVEYWVYNFDFETEEALTGQELLGRLEISQEDFFHTLRCNLAAEHDRENVFLYDQFGDCYDAALELRAQSISARNLNFSQVKPFLGDDGVLTAVINRAVYAGGGAMREMLELSPAAETGITKAVQCEFVSAELKNNQVTVTFQQTPESDWYMPEEGLEYHVPYPVEGLYGSYTDIAIGIMGQDIAPFIFLIDTEGHVSFCDISAALHTSAPRFFASSPLMGIEKAVSFEVESDIGGQLMYVNTEDGQRISLFEHTAAVKSALNNLMKPDSSWCTEDESFILHITEDGAAAVSWNDGSGQLASGTLYYGGMTEEGLQYPFSMWTEGNERIGGVLTLECDTYYTAPEGGSKLIISQLTGPLLPGLPTDGTVSLYRSW